ncbi:MAG: LytTR family DNA-binding domain-containing protein [Deltaproteobacteria bacterium]|nr:LytTR family DNA-binding domain-containing protein [Deltaproteobacteria bacterium]
MSPIPTLIVEDEPLACELLADMLSRYPSIDVVAQAHDGLEAITALTRHHPLLVFLDIRMPGPDGIAIARRLPLDTRVVFVTAHDDRAVEAFEVHAIDYLLKPIAPGRLDRAIERAIASLRLPAAPLTERLALRDGERFVLQTVSEVEWFEAEGKYIRAHVPGQPLRRIRRTMRELAAALDERCFVRVSRSAIVNLDRVQEIQPWFHGDFVLMTDSGGQVTTTRGYRASLERLLGRRTAR